ncbi:NIPSNAP family containing protein [Granulicella sp. WH15]|nr:NIPSNAP family containing protein [Granulicella sp. WH15]
MQRRDFMTRSLAASTLALSPAAFAAAPPADGRQFYELRKYTLSSGPHMGKVTDNYVSEALIPALAKLGIGPVGAFRLDYGNETPTLYLLLPSSTAAALIGLDARLGQDAEYVKAAAEFNGGSTEQPAFHRVDSSLLWAFEGFPKLHVPAKQTRIFQLRTYESPTHDAHLRKVEMFHKGEFEIFRQSGCESVFYSQTLIGPRMPSLTYMLSFKNLAALETGWDAFRANPAWKKLSSEPRYSTDTLVSNVTNLVLSPAPYSQI